MEQNAGKDVTKLFKSLHPPNTLRKFLSEEDNLVGRIDVDEVTKIGGGKNAEDLRIEMARRELRNVDTVRGTTTLPSPSTVRRTDPPSSRRSSASTSSRSSPSRS